MAFYVMEGPLSWTVAHISDESKLPAPDTLWEGRLGLLAFVYVAVDTTGTGLIQL